VKTEHQTPEVEVEVVLPSQVQAQGTTLEIQ
jgi:hypothetical protein